MSTSSYILWYLLQWTEEGIKAARNALFEPQGMTEAADLATPPRLTPPNSKRRTPHIGSAQGKQAPSFSDLMLHSISIIPYPTWPYEGHCCAACKVCRLWIRACPKAVCRTGLGRFVASFDDAPLSTAVCYGMMKLSMNM